MQPIEALQEKIEQSELGREWIGNSLLNQDVWSVEKIGYSEEESKIRGTRNIYFEKFSLSWLKLLAKLTALATAREKSGLSTLTGRNYCLRQLDKFLVTEGYLQPELLTDSLLQKFISIGSKVNKQRTIAYITKLWAEEQWLQLPYTHRKRKFKNPQLEVIPEEVLHQIYENLDLFPPPLERLFRLQLVLGCRIGEMLRMPRQCLKKEGEQWFLLKWVQKRKHWRFYQIHSAVAELVREQQKFLNQALGLNSNFDKLFCKVSTATFDGAFRAARFDTKPVYLPELLSTSIVRLWLNGFSEKVNLVNKQGNKFVITSHKLRRTKASIMAYCEVEDEYIAAVLGHGSLDMLPHYRKRSLERLEKEAGSKGYVDMYGRVSGFKPKKRRYERLAELLKVSTPLGECHRPTMLGDCQYCYACLSCDHHRVTLEDKPKLITDIQRLRQDLKQAKKEGQNRRVTEINRLLKLLDTRLKGLKKIEKLKKTKS